MNRGAADARLWGAVAVLTAIGFALRLAAAQGGLWLDEAWSAVMARDAGSPLGVLLWINHDNSHHLNSLWLQAIGIAAPPPLARAPAIVAGTLAIPLAAAVGLRAGRAAAIVAALAFAISPALVTMGSEARGYAPMLLAALAAIAIVDRWLADGVERRTALALAFGLGMLAQLTMAFAICAIVGWAAIAQAGRRRPIAAFGATLRLAGPALLAAAAVAALVAGAALASGTGFRLGEARPFGFGEFVRGLSEMLGFAFALPSPSPWLLAAVAAALALAWPAGVARLPFHLFAIVGLPLAILILQPVNAGHPRYYLLVAVAALILLAELAARDIAGRGWRRWAAGAALVLFTVASLAADVELIRNQRGDPAAAIRALAARAPGGASVTIDRPSASAAIEVAAASAGYPLAITEAPCPAGRFLLLDRFRSEPPPATAWRCGAGYAEIARGRATGMSGTYWTLYERRP